jgi:hypothetical protein
VESATWADSKSMWVFLVRALFSQCLVTVTLLLAGTVTL